MQKLGFIGLGITGKPMAGQLIKAGAGPAKVRQALMGGFASSRILEVHGERMIKRTFDPGFRIKLHQKHLSLAMQGARELGLALPQTAAAPAPKSGSGNGACGQFQAQSGHPLF